MNDDIEYLRAENQELRSILAKLIGEGEYRFPPEWRLSPSERRILALLITRGSVAREVLFDALYWDDPDPPQTRVLEVFIHHIRYKTGLRCKLETVVGFGYRLTPEAISLLSGYRIKSDGETDG